MNKKPLFSAHNFFFNVTSAQLRLDNDGEETIPTIWTSLNVKDIDKSWLIGEQHVLSDANQDMGRAGRTSVSAEAFWRRRTKSFEDFRRDRALHDGVENSHGEVMFHPEQYDGVGAIQFHMHCINADFDILWDAIKTGRRFSRVHFGVLGGQDGFPSKEDLAYENPFDTKTSIWSVNAQNQFVLQVVKFHLQF